MLIVSLHVFPLENYSCLTSMENFDPLSTNILRARSGKREVDGRTSNRRYKGFPRYLRNPKNATNFIYYTLTCPNNNNLSCYMDMEGQ